MTYQEKGTWVYSFVSLAAFGLYLIWLINQILSIPATTINYLVPMLCAIGGAIIAHITGTILITIAAPKEADKQDERDREIDRYGEYRGQFLVNIGGAIVLGMCMLKIDYFWIVHVMYFAFVGSALTSSVVKIISYRQGFYPK
jgi:hypothetical protein